VNDAVSVPVPADRRPFAALVYAAGLLAIASFGSHQAAALGADVSASAAGLRPAVVVTAPVG